MEWYCSSEKRACCHCLFFLAIVSAAILNPVYISGSLRQWWADPRICRSGSDPAPKFLDPDPLLIRSLTAKYPKKSCFGIELEAFTAPTHINIVKILNKDQKIIRLLEKIRIRIRSGSGQKSPKFCSCSGSLTGVCSSLVPGKVLSSWVGAQVSCVIICYKPPSALLSSCLSCVLGAFIGIGQVVGVPSLGSGLVKLLLNHDYSLM